MILTHEIVLWKISNIILKAMQVKKTILESRKLKKTKVLLHCIVSYQNNKKINPLCLLEKSLLKTFPRDFISINVARCLNCNAACSLLLSRPTASSCQLSLGIKRRPGRSVLALRFSFISTNCRAPKPAGRAFPLCARK